MALDRNRVGHLLREGRLQDLFFEELGWDEAPKRPLPVMVDGQSYTLHLLAQKRDVMALQLRLPTIPPMALRRKIESQVTRAYREHFIIFSDEPYTRQVWQWVRHEPGRTAGRSHEYSREQSPEALIQKLEHIAFSIDQEADLTLVNVVGSVRAAFDVERATKRFFQEFKRQHDRFRNFLQGIPDDELASWYVSVMLNRLMFIYFIQEKGFLAGDHDYLRHQLAESQRTGEDLYYRDVLCPLFFEGFAKPAHKRDKEVSKRLGPIPYLNGGIFQQHQIEQRYGRVIQIPDRAFEQLFDFFKGYQWHLDDRPLRNGNEINPDVLGYIFEQYINQKQMGAYYTKEDITDYISKSTILPFIFDQVRRRQPTAFQGAGSVWRLLQENPERYIYPALQKGVERALPPEIAAGIADVSQRGSWNTPAAEEYALPTEIWRETVARRQRYAEVRDKLASGAVQAINDLITLNLDIVQFTLDVLESCEDPGVLRAFWKTINEVSVLDPTCGSGAFLFAALNILRPLYEACLERMEVFLAYADPADIQRKYRDFREVLDGIQHHPNRTYFILKSVMVNNLYGVDIMEEATEIAKLRLFLKLVAQVSDVNKLEPLPDIDFNIRAGNTLVGFATREQMIDAVRGDKLLLLPEEEEALARIEEQAADVERLFGKFRAMQTAHDLREFGDDYATTKETLRNRLRILGEELDRLLAQQYGVNPDKLEYEPWRKAHQPFHWFVEFYGIMKQGGFHIITGNPPWKEYSAVKRQYQILKYDTERAGNLYGLCIERCLDLRSSTGSLSFIVQLPFVSSSRMQSVRQLLKEQSTHLYVAPFDDRPGKLFNGLQNCRSAIFTARGYKVDGGLNLWVTRYHRWLTEVREQLFTQIEYESVRSSSLIDPDQFPKYHNAVHQSVFDKIKSGTSNLDVQLSTRSTEHFIFYQEATRYWTKATVGLPYYEKNGRIGAPAHGRYLYLKNSDLANTVCAILNSSLFYLYFVSYGDCFHLSQTLVSNFPIFEKILQDDCLIELGRQLMADLVTNATKKAISTKDGDEICYAEFYGGKSKLIIDRIDTMLAQHYGFTPEELDFIINYDIKYRVGDALAEDEAEGDDA